VAEPGQRPLSALPSPAARAAAFVVILLGGAAGGIIGWAFIKLQCDGGCEVPASIGAAIVAVLAALGTAVVAVLVLRAMGEWRATRDAS
jgi:hypothetical protein